MSFVDYLVLAPMDSEWRAARGVLESRGTPMLRAPIGAMTYYCWRQPVDCPPERVGEYLVVGAAMAASAPGQTISGVITTTCLHEWRPDRVVLLGIAGSFDKKRLRLGDVVVATKVCGYVISDALPSGGRFRPTFVQTGALDLDRVRALRGDPVAYPQWQQECLQAGQAAGLTDVDHWGRPIPATLLSRRPELHLEVTGSGNEVVKSVARARELQRDVDHQIRAVEMEADGLHAALYQSAHRTDALMIRGISDYANTAKARLERSTKDGWRAFAAANAARLLTALWREGPVPPLSPLVRLTLKKGPHSRFWMDGLTPVEIHHTPAPHHLAFPELIRRDRPTPPLRLTIHGTTTAGATAVGGKGVCRISAPPGTAPSTLSSVVEGGEPLAFRIAPTEHGLEVELLVSFPEYLRELVVRCEEERFCRVTEARLLMP
jgi:nucleoside phosphorylase